MKCRLAKGFVGSTSRPGIYFYKFFTSAASMVASLPKPSIAMPTSLNAKTLFKHSDDTRDASIPFVGNFRKEYVQIYFYFACLILCI